MAKRAKRRTKSKRRRTRSTKQRGGSVLNYLLPFALWKVKDMVGKKTKKRRTRKSK